MANLENAGEKLHASLFSFPAATLTTTPAFVAALIALSWEEEVPDPPRLMLMTAGFLPLDVTQSMAETCQELDPEPLSPKVLTACNCAL